MLSYSQSIPFIGELSFKVYSDVNFPGQGALVLSEERQQALGRDLVQTCWGWDSISKAVNDATKAAADAISKSDDIKTVSLDMDAKMGIAMFSSTASVCFEAQIP